MTKRGNVACNCPSFCTIIQMMTNKEQYKILCDEQGPNIPLFLQHWWMEAVCHGKQWDVILVERDGKVVAAMPYLIGKRWGMKYILQPQLTQYNGLWYRKQDFKTENKRLDFEKWAINKVVEQLDKLGLAYYQQNFSPGFTNWLPLYWHGFKQTTRYTYRINSLKDSDKVFANFDRKHRQKPILQLADSLKVVWDITPEDFYDFHDAYWKSRGKKDLLSKDFTVRVCNAAIVRDQGFIIGLRDDEGNLMAARFVVYDSRCAYSLMSALNPQGHPNGTSPMLFWEAMKHLADKTKAFDFEGSMFQGIEQSYRLYGARQTQYFAIEKTNSTLFQILKYIKERK